MRKKFNILDRFLSSWRFGKIKGYLSGGQSVCDLGCGDGKMLSALNSDIGFNHAVGVDAFAEFVADERVTYVRMDLRSLELEENSFDRVLMLALIEHIETEDAQKVLKQAYRILKPGGLLLLTTPTPLAKPVLEFMAYKLKVISRDEIEDHKYYYNIKELDKLLKTHKFKKIDAKHFQLFMNSFFVYEK